MSRRGAGSGLRGRIAYRRGAGSGLRGRLTYRRGTESGIWGLIAEGDIRSFKDLRVWKEAIQLAKGVYRLTDRFPKGERFGLVMQMRRAVVSVSSNIAEGHSRQGHEFPRFLSIARGSLAETESQIVLSVELGLAPADAARPLLDQIEDLRRMTAGLMRRLTPDPAPRTPSSP